MRLFIAEKPSLGKAIADVLGVTRKHKNYIECGQDVVCWCVGHIMEAAAPEAYDPKFASWDIDDLPIIPSQWKMLVTVKDLYNNISQLAKKASVIVNAGDADREGQRLIDEVIEGIGFRGRVERILISDLNPSAVAKELTRLRPNSEFQNLSHSALARSRADWLFGMNMTRLYTTLGQKGGYSGVLSVGRVQTPLLGLIVRRDNEIANFKPKPFFGIRALISTSPSFITHWRPGKRAESLIDEEGRLLSKDFAAKLCASLSGKSGQVTDYEVKKQSNGAPLPHSLSTIQMEAAKVYGYSANETLEACQALYETYKVTTYPRSDCSYLPEEHFSDVETVLGNLRRMLPDCNDLIKGCDTSIKSKAWNDKKVTAHHAIIPTSKNADVSAFSEREKRVFVLIVKRYLSQFYPPYIYESKNISINCFGEIFIAKGKTPLKSGWKSIYGAEIDDDDSEDNDDKQALPSLSVGQNVTIGKCVIDEKKTSPPKRFTDETIIKAMNNIAAYVDNPSIKKVLKETDGLGTPATQGSIIETLFKRSYVERKGKQIQSTSTGRDLISMLPSVATTPDMTAFWESAMQRIVEGEFALDSFMGVVSKQVRELTELGKKQGALKISGFTTYPCSRNGCTGVLTKRSGSKGKFWWGCSEFKNGCKESFDDLKGKPVKRKLKKPFNKK